MCADKNGNETEQKRPIYIDFNATTPLDPEVISVISDSLKNDWGNPSSGHLLGRNARSVIEESRLKVATMIGGKPEDIIFTSGGTEANNLALYSAIQENGSKNLQSGLPHAITCSVEHDSIIKVLQNWSEKDIIELSIAEADPKTGCVSSESVTSLIKAETCLISIMHANNESGVVMPVKEIGDYLESIRPDRSSAGFRRIFLHSDAAQTVGKIAVNVNELKVDYLTIVGHKFYGPRIGALYAKSLGSSTPLYPLLHGGGQERGHRAGTENTPMIAGLGCAADLVSKNILNYGKNMLECREHFMKSLLSTGFGFEVNFLSASSKLPNTLSLAVPRPLLASSVLEATEGLIYASMGAACHSDTGKPSGILIASGLSAATASRTIRISFGRYSTMEEIDQAVQIIIKSCQTLLKDGSFI